MNSRVLALGAAALLACSVAFGQTMTAPVPVLNLNPGWNLVGNSSNKPIDAPGLFSAYASTVLAVWRWNRASSEWDFYTPAAGINSAQYAASKGYGALASIPVGEGFWVNVNGNSAPGGLRIEVPYDSTYTAPTATNVSGY